MDGDKPKARGVLAICDGGFEGMEYELTSDEVLIGRNPNTTITLLDENISREQQGYLGVIGAMMSGVTMANMHVLSKD